MNSDLEKIYDEAKSALQIKDGGVYCKIIDTMLETATNKDVIRSFESMKLILFDKIYFDEDKTPKQLSLDFFGFNLFTWDVFDYYLMVDVLIIDKLNGLFNQIELNDYLMVSIATAELSKEYSINKSNILSIFEPKDRYVRHTGKNYPFKTMLFQDYLAERSDWLIFLEKEINILNELLGG